MAELPLAALPLIFLVALLYSSVGHGGASGYLAVLALLGLSPAASRSSALILNLLVAGIAFLSYWRAGHSQGRLFWPFATASIPLAWVGGYVRVPASLYSGLLACALFWASWRLWRGAAEEPASPAAQPRTATALGVGAGLGLLSGVVGVGGGIFLSPLMILKGWADAKRTAAVSAAFIWVNSAAGLLGALARGGPRTLGLAPLAAVALAGGLIGSQIGAQRLASPVLRRLLAVVLLTAAAKLLRVAVAGA